MEFNYVQSYDNWHVNSLGNFDKINSLEKCNKITLWEIKISKITSFLDWATYESFYFKVWCSTQYSLHVEGHFTYKNILNRNWL